MSSRASASPTVRYTVCRRDPAGLALSKTQVLCLADDLAHAETRRTLLAVQRKLAEAERANARLIEANLGLHA